MKHTTLDYVQGFDNCGTAANLAEEINEWIMKTEEEHPHDEFILRDIKYSVTPETAHSALLIYQIVTAD